MKKIKEDTMNEILDNSIFSDRARDIPFSPKEVAVISSCGFWMKFIAFSLNIVSFLLSLLSIGIYVVGFSTIGKSQMLFSATVYLIIAIVGFILGRSVYKSARAFKDVLNTSIDDQGFLVEGFVQLQRFFLTLGILIFLLVILLIAFTVLWSFSSLQNGII
jgi:hypothetical protein